MTTRWRRTTSARRVAAAIAAAISLAVIALTSVLLHAQHRARTRQAELAAVSDASPIGMFRAGTDGLMTYVNDAYLRIQGLEAHEAADGWLRLLRADVREHVWADWRRVVNDLRAVQRRALAALGRRPLGTRGGAQQPRRRRRAGGGPRGHRGGHHRAGARREGAAHARGDLRHHHRLRRAGRSRGPHDLHEPGRAAPRGHRGRRAGGPPLDRERGAARDRAALPRGDRAAGGGARRVDRRDDAVGRAAPRVPVQPHPHRAQGRRGAPRLLLHHHARHLRRQGRARGGAAQRGHHAVGGRQPPGHRCGGRPRAALPVRQRRVRGVARPAA